ncbi:MAG: hypothetical protein NVS1B6_00200 [Steroidobacteraceae bacterium]
MSATNEVIDVTSAGPSEYKTLTLAQLRESALNPRKHFADGPLNELANSIGEKGIVEPLVVRMVGDQFEIIAGARRYRGATIVANRNGGPGHYEVPCRVLLNIDDQQALELMVIENSQRENVHPMEEAVGYQQLLATERYDVAALALKIGREEGYIRRRLSLLNLNPEIQEEFIADPRLTLSHALAIARLPRPEDQTAVMEWWGSQREWNRGRDRAIIPNAMANYIYREILLNLAAAPFPILDGTLFPEAGACPECPKRSGYQAALFPDITKNDMCLDAACYQTKRANHTARKKAELEAEGKKLVRVTTQYRAVADAVPIDAYVRIEGKIKSCQFAEDAEYVDGDNQGGLTKVCRAKECPIHARHNRTNFGNSGPSKHSSRLAERKREFDAALVVSYREELANRIRLRVGEDKVKVKDNKRNLDLQVIAHALYDRADSETRKHLSRAFGFTAMKAKHEGGLADWETPVKNAMDKDWTNAQVMGSILAMAAHYYKGSPSLNDRYSHDYDDDGNKSQAKPTVLEQTARRHSIDPAVVKAEVTEKLTASWAARFSRLEKQVAAEAEADRKIQEELKAKAKPAKKEKKKRKGRLDNDPRPPAKQPDSQPAVELDDLQAAALAKGDVVEWDDKMCGILTGEVESVDGNTVHIRLEAQKRDIRAPLGAQHEVVIGSVAGVGIETKFRTSPKSL